MWPPPKTRRDLGVRWLALAFVSTAMFGSYYAYDNASALKEELQDALNMNDKQFNLLYTVYSIPNMALPLFGGYIVDHMGANRCILMFSCLVTVGQFIFATGVEAGNLSVSLAGRAVFGLGGESLCVAQFAAIARWFSGVELALAMALSTTMTRLGTVMNDFVSPAIYKLHVPPFMTGAPPAPALWFGFWVCLLSSACSALLLALDVGVGRRLRAANGPPRSRRGGPSLDAGGSLLGGAEVTHAEDEDESGDKMALKDIRLLGRRFFLLAATCALTYASIYPFNNIAGGLLQDKYGMDLKKADFIMALPYVISAVLSPCFGSLVDRYGRRSALMVSASSLIASAHILFALTDVAPFLPLSLLGLGFSIFGAVVWPSVALVVAQKAHGTAYGLTTATQNTLMALVPLLAGQLKDSAEARDPAGLRHDRHYAGVEVLFAALAAAAVVAGARLMMVDRRKGGVLRRVASTVIRPGDLSGDPISVSQANVAFDIADVRAGAGDLYDTDSEEEGGSGGGGGLRAPLLGRRELGRGGIEAGSNGDEPVAEGAGGARGVEGV